MKRICIFFSLLLVLLIVFTTTGCNLPDMFAGNPSSSSRTPGTQTSPPVTGNPASSQTATQPVASSPIDPTFIIPTTSSQTVSLVEPDFVSVIASVRPSVVAITTRVSAISIFGGSFTQEGAGSGWIIDSSGLIVTNNHVVQDAANITVTLEDGRAFEAETVRTDPTSDLAVIQIDAEGLPAAKVGDSSRLQVGEWVVAIGNSLGQGISATKGIVSALGVTVSANDGQTLSDLIQTDAAINPGNSGGPLINMAGEVIGINSVKVAQVGVEGMGYAISTQVAVPLIENLINLGYVVRPWMGVSLYQVDEAAIRQLNLSVKKGILLTQVVADGPADKAGLKRYDVITSYDGKEATTVEDLVKYIRSRKVGESVEIVYWRDNRQHTTTLILEQSPVLQ